MNEFDKYLFEYADTFGENFPTFLFRNKSMAAVIEIIKQCLKDKKPVKTKETGSDDY